MPAASATASRSTPLVWVVVGLLLVAALVAGAFFIPQLRAATDDSAAAAAPLPPPTTVAAYGRLEPDGGIREVAGPAGERVEAVLVAIGERVEAGQPVARMESHAIRASEVAALEVQIAETEASRADVDRSANLQRQRADIAQAKSDEPVKLALEAAELRVEMATLALGNAEDTLKRLESLARRPAQAQLEGQRQLVSKAKMELEAANLQLKTAQADAQQGRREAQLVSTAAEIEAESGQRQLGLPVLEAKLGVAQAALDRTIVRAPVAGEVVDIVTRAGEAPNARPILRIAATDRMVVVAEVFEADVRRLAGCQAATVQSDALSQPLTGHVARIGRIVGPNAIRSLNPMAPTDRRVVEVTIALPEEAAAMAASLLGLQVDVTIDTARVLPLKECDAQTTPDEPTPDEPTTDAPTTGPSPNDSQPETPVLEEAA